jgi:hypothetical protein
MPTSLALTWLESRAAADRLQADIALETFFCPRRDEGRDRMEFADAS